MPKLPTVDEVTVPGRRAVPRSRRGWQQLVREIDSCRRCPLGYARQHVVVHRGSLRPRVVFVGEAPGEEEDRVGRPFVGRAGRRLDTAIESLGLRSREFAIINVFKCRPPENRFRSDAALACRPFLAQQLDFLRPRVVVPMGSHALEAFRPDALPILRSAGTRLQWRGRLLFPLVHPAAALHAPALARRWERDLRRLQRALSPTEVK
jgi:uracil-DNA glycosylase family 4